MNGEERKVVCFLIDDDADDREIFSIAVDGLGENVTCVTAEDAVDALKIINGDHGFIPDYIFIDLNMPRLNGKECLVEIRKIPRLQEVPVIMYSTSAEPREVEETKRLGASQFFTKPSNITDFIKALSGIMDTDKQPLAYGVGKKD